MELPQSFANPLGINEVCELIFSKPPQDECSISLGIDNISDLLPNDASIEEKTAFEKKILIDILFLGIKHLFALDFNKMEHEERLITFENIQYDDFKIVEKYMKSFGYKPIVYRYYKDSMGDPEKFKKITGISISFENLWEKQTSVNSTVLPKN